MVTARKANKTLGEHAVAHEAVTRLGSNKKVKPVKPLWTLENIEDNLVGQGILAYLKRHTSLSIRDINTAANRLTKIADSDIKEGKARDYVARVIGYNNYDALNVTVRAAVPVRNHVQRRKANQPVTELLIEDEELPPVTHTEINPLVMLALQREISKRGFRLLGKNYRAFVNKDNPEHTFTLMQAYNYLAKQLGYPDYHSMPRQYPIINLRYVD
ncbi:hypothetical protein Ea357_072 [Erwinia phage Ea35-70]|uniref:Uncharacterized protein n=3 Tax=Agricanvirus TaxID=1984776 RepID=W6AR64_9CAUD|nr:hypothetical protein Ea357_072 [Erwinia phage Ea35-70]YP_009605859.1 hypothetical protein FDH99_gp075 [Erwinia phage vB_EamM_Simmy50]AHI60223.1 hypothetical protein Ea357_072 [Erwinia phage Ea35-70]ANH51537.1 hypothetical protein SIMMY50_75 [Erwinia phage vB_EamM_Simmy50]AUG86502.1 hypothetical protein MADMEL_74 [Erwinia phage vB_EamM_MadMel]